MDKNKSQFKESLRIIFAIAWKDIVDGWKNKVILTSILTSVFLIVFYHYMPELTRGDRPPLIVIMGSDDGPLMQSLYEFTEVRVYPTESKDTFLNVIRDSETPALGIELSEGYDLEDNAMKLQGYYPYWMKPEQVNMVVGLVEAELGRDYKIPVTISTTGNTVYPIMSAYPFGKTFLATAGFLMGFVLMGLSMGPQLIIEEKDAQTLQAIVISPANLGHFICGKAIATLFYSTLTTGISLIVFGPLVLNWGLLFLALVLGMLAIILPGILLGVVIDSKQQLGIWSWMMFIPTLLPLFFSIVTILPDYLMTIIYWWPTVVISRLIQAGMTYDTHFKMFNLELLYVIGFIIVFFFITLLAIRQKTIKGT